MMKDRCRGKADVGDQKSEVRANCEGSSFHGLTGESRIFRFYLEVFALRQLYILVLTHCSFTHIICVKQFRELKNMKTATVGEVQKKFQ